MITAKEALEMAEESGKTYEKHLKYLEEKIASAAKKGETSVVIRDRPYNGWMYSPKDMTKGAKNVVDTLKQQGFKVTLYYEELQFVDMGLWIKWGDE